MTIPRFALAVALLAICAGCAEPGGNLPFVHIENYVLQPAAPPDLVAGDPGAALDLFESVTTNLVIEVANEGVSGTDGSWDYTQLTDRAVQLGELQPQLKYFEPTGSAQMDAAPLSSIINWQDVGSTGFALIQLRFASAAVQQAINGLKSLDEGQSAPFEVRWTFSGQADGADYRYEFRQQMIVLKTH